MDKIVLIQFADVLISQLLANFRDQIHLNC